MARWADRLDPLLTLVLVCAVVEGLSRFDVLPRHGFPPLSQMLSTLANQIGTRSFWSLVGETLKGVGYGLGIAVALAVPAGVAVGSAELAYRAVRGVVEFLRPIPSVALVPLAVLVWGTGFTSKLFLVVYAAFWPLFVQTLYGMRDVDPVMVDTARDDNTASPSSNSYQHFLDKTINENHNSRVAILAAQQYACGIGVESKFSSSTGQTESYVAVRAGEHLDSDGTIRMSVRQ